MTWINLYSYTTYLGMMTPAVWISTSSQSAPAGGLWPALITIVRTNTATILRKFRDPNFFLNGFIYVWLCWVSAAAWAFLQLQGTGAAL